MTKHRAGKAKAAPTPEQMHLHVVLDPELGEGLKAHAAKLSPHQPNISVAARDLLRAALGLDRGDRAKDVPTLLTA